MSIFSDYKVGAITEDEFKNGYAFSRGDDHGERAFMDEWDDDFRRGEYAMVVGRSKDGCAGLSIGTIVLIEDVDKRSGECLCVPDGETRRYWISRDTLDLLQDIADRECEERDGYRRWRV